MKPTRRRFTREFKLEVMRQLQAGRRQADVARELGVDAQVIRRWKDQVQVDPDTAFPGHGRRARKEEELQRLRREVAQLRAERHFLNKAAAFFAKTSR
jgi:transposase